MLPSILSTTLLLAVLPAGVALVRAQAVGQETAGAAGQEAPGEEWRSLVERSASATFTARTAASALEDLRSPDVDARLRGLALFALGAARVTSERARLESWALQGGESERCAALLGLGEMDTAEPALLVRIARQEAGEVAECALLALLRTGRAGGIQHVAGVAKADGPLADAARELLRFRDDPASSTPRAARRLLELRYEAARRHGLVDGLLWSARVLAERLADEDFLDAVIYRSASEMRKPGVRDQFLELLLEGGNPAAVRGAVNAMPVQVAQLVENELWEPADEAEWGLILAEIDERRMEGLVKGLLQRALTLPSLRGWTALLLVRGGQSAALPLLATELQAADLATRLALVRGVGATGMLELAPVLVRMLGHEPELQAAVLVAQLRLGQKGAPKAVEQGLQPPDDLQRMSDPEAADAALRLRQALIEELARAARAREVAPLLESLLPDLAGPARTAALAGLFSAGSRSAGEELRELLRSAPPSGELGMRCISVLSSRATPQDMALLREMFPRQDAREIDVEVAVALTTRRDLSMRPLLRAALWRGPFHRSVLAAGLLHDAGGDVALRLELENPPRSAGTGDLRRVGFAVGVWGGRAAAEALGARSSSSDPAVQGAHLGALLSQTF